MSYAKDTNRISLANLPSLPKVKSKKQEFLSKGYRIFMIDGSWYAEKDGERVEIKESE